MEESEQEQETQPKQEIWKITLPLWSSACHHRWTKKLLARPSKYDECHVKHSGNPKNGEWIPCTKENCLFKEPSDAWEEENKGEER